MDGIMTASRAGVEAIAAGGYTPNHFWQVSHHLHITSGANIMSQAEEVSRRSPAKTTAAQLAHLAPPRLDELSPQNLYDKCMALARNLWWSWHPEVTNLFRELDPIRWRQLDHNPIALLAEFTPERLEARAAELVLYSRINQAFRRLKEYLAAGTTWSDVNAGVLGSKPVVYFSAEFGIHE